jgi:UDP-N-acetylbacillosamine N-acetyltransferase
MLQKLVIWGTSGHALVVADAIRSRTEYEIVGFIDDVHPERRGTEFCGALILGGREQLDILHRKGITNLIFGFGDCQARLKLAGMVREKGFQLVTAIHCNAVVASDVFVGKGTMIAAGAVVNSAARVGENVIINTTASVDHECIIEAGAHICPGVHLAGRVHIGQGAWIGIGATVVEQINIGTGAMIGAGALVLRDVPDFMLAYGVPAKVIRKIKVDI